MEMETERAKAYLFCFSSRKQCAKSALGGEGLSLNTTVPHRI